MDYQRHYNLLIDRARNRKLTGYVEKHHVVPRCLGGTDRKENLVRLTPEEHYLAHQLLVKMNPGNLKLIYAASMMGATRSSNKLYGWLKRRFIESQLGKKHSEETKLKLRKPKSETAKQNISIAAQNRSPEARANYRASKVGLKKFASPDGQVKMFRPGEEPNGWKIASKPAYVKQGTKGKYQRTPEHRMKMSTVISQRSTAEYRP